MPLFDEALARAREAGDPIRVARILSNHGVLAYLGGDQERAARHSEEGIALFRTVDDGRGLSVVLHNLGLVSLGLGDTSGAVELLEESRMLDARSGDHAHLANVLRALARALVSERQPERAVEMLRESLELLHTLDDPGGTAELLEILAAALALRGEGPAAARLFGRASGAPRVDRRPAPVRLRGVGRVVAGAALRGELGAEAFDAALARGRTLDTDEALREALTSDPERSLRSPL